MTALIEAPYLHADAPTALLTPPLQLVDCPACGLPATVEEREMLAGLIGPVIQLTLRCPFGRHTVLLTEEDL